MRGARTVSTMLRNAQNLSALSQDQGRQATAILPPHRNSPNPEILMCLWLNRLPRRERGRETEKRERERESECPINIGGPSRPRGFRHPSCPGEEESENTQNSRRSHSVPSHPRPACQCRGSLLPWHASSRPSARSHPQTLRV